MLTHVCNKAQVHYLFLYSLGRQSDTTGELSGIGPTAYYAFREMTTPTLKYQATIEKCRIKLTSSTFCSALKLNTRTHAWKTNGQLLMYRITTDFHRAVQTLEWSVKILAENRKNIWALGNFKIQPLSKILKKQKKKTVANIQVREAQTH